MTTPEELTLSPKLSASPSLGSPKSPGQVLRQARQALGVSLRVMATRTRIAESALEHLESDMYDEFPVLIFLKGHLRCYSRELGLDSEEFLVQFERYTGIPVTETGAATRVSRLEEDLQSDSLRRSASMAASNSNAGSTSVVPVNKTSVSTSVVPTNRSTSQRLRSSGQKKVDRTISPLSSTVVSGLRKSSELARLSPSAVTGSHRCVIGRNGQDAARHVSRGPTLQGEDIRQTGGLNGQRATIAGRFSKLRERLVGREGIEIEQTASQPNRLENSTEGVRRTTSTLTVRASIDYTSQESTPNQRGVQPRSKIERGAVQLKAFAAKYYIAIIALVAASVVAVGLLSGEPATAQDPANFPKNRQDTWELEKQADQTRWLLEQPDGQVDDEVQAKANHE